MFQVKIKVYQKLAKKSDSKTITKKQVILRSLIDLVTLFLGLMIHNLSVHIISSFHDSQSSWLQYLFSFMI